MRIEVAFLPAELSPDISNRTVVVIDVLRASSTIITAFENNCRSVIPVEHVHDARKMAEKLGSSVLLCGERGGLIVNGFDLGNSPFEYTHDRVSGKDIVLTTTNGTKAIQAASKSAALLICAFLNMASVAQKSIELGNDTVILCAGRCDTFSLEDTVCSGMLVATLCEISVCGSLELADSAVAARQLYLSFNKDIRYVLDQSEHGQILSSLGRTKDLHYCASVNISNLVPVLERTSLTLQLP